MTAPRLRKTKIIATVGPASDAIETLEGMIAAGMDVARLNLSFGTFADHLDRISRIRAAAQKKGANIAVMADTRGIEIRTGKVMDGAVTLAPGARFTLYTDGRVGDIEGVSISCRSLPEEVTSGTPILLDDGAIELEVESTGTDSVRCKVIAGAILRDHKGVNLPATPLPRSVLDGHDRELLAGEIRFAAEADVDYIAASFVQNAGDVEGIREVLREHAAAIPIIAKIENRAGLDNLDAIVQAADGIMVARGDLGVELPLAEVPATQKHMIHTTVMNGKPVITATQMLASMEIHPRPTRAEASDVANAILDGTSAIMLSGETAAGKFPVEAVRTMAELALRAEAHLREYGYLQKILPHPSDVVTEAVSQASVAMARQLAAAAIFSLTETGFTSRLVSKHRPDCPILAITASPRVARKLAMNWGVLPLLCAGEGNDEAKIAFAIGQAASLGYLRAGDIVVATSGHAQRAGGTDLIRVITV
ncbi:MAG: pyruvate kinase [Gammaproteobacteria bacterium]